MGASEIAQRIYNRPALKGLLQMSSIIHYHPACCLAMTAMVLHDLQWSLPHCFLIPFESISLLLQQWSPVVMWRHSIDESANTRWPMICPLWLAEGELDHVNWLVQMIDLIRLNLVALEFHKLWLRDRLILVLCLHCHSAVLNWNWMSPLMDIVDHSIVCAT